jgi:hypothetical protein
MTFTSRKEIFENMEYTSPSDSLYAGYYNCEKGTFFPQKEGVYSRNTFFFLKNIFSG